MSPAPIIIVAAPFCGSSWLAGVMSTMPDIYATPQLCAFMADTVGELLEIFSLSQDEHGDGLHRTVAELCFGGQRDAEIAQAHQWLTARATRPVTDVLDEIAALVAPRRLLMPETEAPLRPMELQRMRRWRDDTQFVHMVRHPWTQGCRFAAWLQDRLFVPVDFRDYSRFPPLPEPQIPWLRANCNIDNALGDLGDARVLRVISEALDTDFGDTMTVLARGLGLPHASASWATLRDPAEWRFAGRGPDQAPGGLEADVRGAWSDDAERLARMPTLDQPLPWRPDGRGFAAEVLQLAERYGYR
ncbi:sulfotransferase [Solimonas marina]|uniref:Sulfotransferase n=1 Tax=Solimonas marina TaxID=2714601 RepID=A0A969W7I9_9GAMM|nr:sulfotransferase [Solimonas marina]NKF21403.1 sulfotransferase [Solimonas marina]